MITTTKPIPLEVVAKIKNLLASKPRELAWFQLSLNTALRGGDVLELLCADVQGDLITFREKKTKKLRSVRLNAPTLIALQEWLTIHPGKTEYLFEGTRGRMRTSYWSQLLKSWCVEVGYDEPRVATHSCRKTFVKTHYERGTKLATLMHVLNHSSERQVLTYCGIMAEDVDMVYASAI